MRQRFATRLLPCALLLAAAPAMGQQAARLPDIELTAHVSAESIRFDARPQVAVTFPGSPDRRNVWDSVRTRLPDPVLPGRTYEDVAVDLVISTTLPETTPTDTAPPSRSPR